MASPTIRVCAPRPRQGLSSEDTLRKVHLIHNLSRRESYLAMKLQACSGQPAIVGGGAGHRAGLYLTNPCTCSVSPSAPPAGRCPGALACPAAGALGFSGLPLNRLLPPTPGPSCPEVQRCHRGSTSCCRARLWAGSELCGRKPEFPGGPRAPALVCDLRVSPSLQGVLRVSGGGRVP